MKAAKGKKKDKAPQKERRSMSPNDKNLKKLAMLKPPHPEEEKKSNKRPSPRKLSPSPNRRVARSASPKRHSFQIDDDLAEAKRELSEHKKERKMLVPDEEMNEALKKALKVKSSKEVKALKKELLTSHFEDENSYYTKNTAFTNLVNHRFGNHNPEDKKFVTDLRDEIIAATEVFEQHVLQEMTLAALLKQPTKEPALINKAIQKQVFQKLHLSFLNRNFSMGEVFARDWSKDFKKEEKDLTEEEIEKRKERAERMKKLQAERRAKKEDD